MRANASGAHLSSSFMASGCCRVVEIAGRSCSSRMAMFRPRQAGRTIRTRSGGGPIGSLDEELWDKIIGTNLKPRSSASRRRPRK